MVAVAQPTRAGEAPNLALIEALVRSRVTEMRGMFKAFADLCNEDLVQDGIIRALKVHRKFTPTRGKYSTLISSAVTYALRDVARGRGREWKRIRNVRIREGVSGLDDEKTQVQLISCPREPSQPADDRNVGALKEIQDWYEAGEGAGLPGGMGGDDETQEDWLAKVYHFAQGVFDDRRRGPKVGAIERGAVVRVYSRAQRVAVALLMRKRGLSEREAARVFDCRDMRSAVGFEDAPSPRWFGKARRTCVRIFGETVRTPENY